MKSYVFTCRNTSGALSNGHLQAIDRADALCKLRAMGYVPVSVIESSARVAPSSRFFVGRKTFIFCLCASLLVTVCLVVFLHRGRPTIAYPLSVSQTISKPTFRPQAKSTKKVIYTTQEPAPLTGSVASVTVALPVPEEPSKLSTKPSGSEEPVSTPEVVENLQRRPSTYKSNTERLLSMALSLPPGAKIPPLPIAGDLDSDLVASLTNTIVIFEDDDSHTATVKENVAAAKVHLLEAIKQGRRVADVLREYEQESNKASNLREEAQHELSKLIEAGNFEEAEAFTERVNQAFSDMGLEPISLSRTGNK